MLILGLASAVDAANSIEATRTRRAWALVSRFFKVHPPLETVAVFRYAGPVVSVCPGTSTDRARCAICRFRLVRREKGPGMRTTRGSPNLTLEPGGL